MPYQLPPLAALRALESSARHLSFKKAAEELHVTPAAISQQIRALEDYLGVELFRRLTRALELTEEGAAMLPKIREGFQCLAAAIETTRRARTGILMVTAPPSFATRWLVARLSRFFSAFPNVELRLASDPDTVDRRRGVGSRDEALVDAREDVAHVAIRYGVGRYPGFAVDRIFEPEYVPVCSPALLRSTAPLQVPADLRRHTLIHDDTIQGERDQPDWANWLKTAGVADADASHGPRYSNAVLAIEAAIEGQGVALTMKPLVEADLKSGRLVIPFDIALHSPYSYFLLVPDAMSGRATVNAFRSWLLSEVEAIGE